MAIGAIDFVVCGDQFVAVWNFDDIGVAVDAGPHLVVFDEKAAVRIVDLRPVRVARWRPFLVCMAFQAGFVIAEILGESRRAEPECQHGKESCSGCRR